MRKGKQDRQKALQTISCLYKRAEGFDLLVCAYCGDPRQSLDHVPPLSYASEYMDIEDFIKKGGKFILYPCCHICNSLLGKRKLGDYIERIGFLHKKYLALSTKSKWDDYEMSELGKNLKLMITAHKTKRRYYQNKLQGVTDMLLKHEV